MHAVPSRALVGKLIANRYLVADAIGAGGLCTVYRAEDLRRGRDVAVKVLPADKSQHKELAARFGREVTTAKRIDHANVATIIDSGALEDGALYLVMELLRGTLLSTALEAGRLPTARALIIARQMLTGLGEAHRLGIVHRDVKPQNVMLVDVNGVEVVKLFDFGIASNDRAALKLTAPGTAFGTPEYIAPEQAMGQKVDARADVYGVGVVLFEMATGRLPFQSDVDLGYLRAHIKQPPPAPSSVAKDAQLSRAFDAIVLKALQKEPEARFETAEAMIAAIDKAAGHRPLQEGATSGQSGVRKVVMLLILLALAVVILHFAHLL
ncbi:MAG TPA: serine/threonine-protein kinase [Polyangia bacterium]|nr:serine/threonine-protein kinase [Polyangia bacterium]